VSADVKTPSRERVATRADSSSGAAVGPHRNRNPIGTRVKPPCIRTSPAMLRPARSILDVVTVRNSACPRLHQGDGLLSPSAKGSYAERSAPESETFDRGRLRSWALEYGSDASYFFFRLTDPNEPPFLSIHSAIFFAAVAAGVTNLS
jgi:hypothetical protein